MTRQQRKRWLLDQVRLFKFMGVKYPYNRPKSEWSKPYRSKIVCLSDPHVPYANRIVLSSVVKYEKNAEMIIVPGDLGDYYSKSRFRKTRHQSFSTELREVFKMIEWFATHWQTVKIMIGNHDNRPEKYVISRIQSEVDILIMTEANMLDRLTGYFDNVELVGTQLDKTDFNISHVWQLGDITFTHGELSLKQNSAILKRVEDWVNEWGKLLQLKPYRVLAQAHNHRGEETYTSYGKRFLLPTASNPFSPGFEYIYEPAMRGVPPAVGYTIFYQERGQTDLNQSHNIVFEVSNGKTKPIY